MRYFIDSIQIIHPTEMQILDPTPVPALTLVTCYPFEFIGNAPMRYIIRATPRTEREETAPMRNVEIALILGLSTLAADYISAAACAHSETFVVRADVNMIVVHATVQDRQGGFISGLTKDAFTIAEDGVRQQIASFTSDDVPVAVGLVIDNSGSMGGPLGRNDHRRADLYPRKPAGR